MNKYQEALKIMCNGCDVASNGVCDGFNMACHAYKPLKELVDKATPKKKETRKDFPSYISVCPACHTIIPSSDRYCSNCGQRVDMIVGDEDV